MVPIRPNGFIEPCIPTTVIDLEQLVFGESGYVPASARRPASVIVSQVTSIRRLPPGNVPRVALASLLLTTSVSISSLNPCSIMTVTV
jgi:hypothetical protein